MENRRFIALGDLIADFYYNGTKLLAVDGGSTRYNVIANLACSNCRCAVIGGSGSDIIGQKIIRRLEKMNIDTSDIFLRNRQIRAYHLSIIPDKLPKVIYKCSKNSPQNNESTWYDNTEDDIIYYLDKVKNNDVIILDDVDEFSMAIINQFSCDKVIDLGNTKRIQQLKNSQMENLKNKFQIMQLNERVVPYLLQRLDGTNILDIYQFFKPELMIVTHERNGAEFVFKNNIYNKKLLKVAEEVDATGAGDAFLSVFIKDYYNNSKYVDYKFIDDTFKKASNLTYDVVQKLGARGHIYSRTLEESDIKENEDLGQEL